MRIKPPPLLILWAGLASAGAMPLGAAPTPTVAQQAVAGNRDSAPMPADPAAAVADRSEADAVLVESERLFREHRVDETLGLLEGILASEPEHLPALLAAARSAIAKGLLSEGSGVQNQWYQTAEATALRAIEVVPEGIDGLYWLLTAKGLRAVQSGSREAATLGGEVFDLAHQILQLDSLHAGAHHALGVLNYEVRKLPRVKRFFARHFLGADVMGLTSWEDAERYLTRAVELTPDFILFHFDLGILYQHRDRDEEARVHFERARELPAFEPPDPKFQEEARQRLAEMGPRDQRHPPLG